MGYVLRRSHFMKPPPPACPDGMHPQLYQNWRARWRKALEADRRDMESEERLLRLMFWGLVIVAAVPILWVALFRW